MPVPSDPWNFVNDIDIADGDKVDDRFLELYRTLDPAAVGVDEANVNAATLKRLGLNDAAQGQVGRGSVVNTASEVPPTTYGASMPTPDRITGLDVPTGALIVMRYSARFGFVATHATNYVLRGSVWVGGTQITQLMANSYFAQTLDLASNTGGLGGFYGSAGTVTTPGGGVAQATGPLGLLGYLTSGALTGTPGTASMGGAWTVLDPTAAATMDLEVKWQLLTAGGPSATVQDRRLQAYVWAP